MEEINLDIDFYMNEAFKQCEISQENGEVPVGCVFLHLPSMQIIAKGHNLTNLTKNATTHAEINCINYIDNKLNSDERESFLDKYKIELEKNQNEIEKIFNDCVLFVSCEPCIMCAHALSLVRIKKVYFGCENDKFGGNGSILSLNKGPNYTYESIGGFMKEKAIEYFRNFYIRGNAKAPDHKRQRKLV